jgi:hypothetical protein
MAFNARLALSRDTGDDIGLSARMRSMFFRADGLPDAYHAEIDLPRFAAISRV